MKNFFKGIAFIPVGMGVAFAESTFKDVPTDHWAKNSVKRLQHVGIIEGSKETYRGESNLSRYEMAVMMERMLKIIESTKAEVQELKSQLSQVKNTQKTGISEDLEETLLEIQDNIEDLQDNSEQLDEKSKQLDIYGYIHSMHFSRKNRMVMANPTAGAMPANIAMPSDSFNQHHTSLMFVGEQDNFDYLLEMKWFNSGNPSDNIPNWVDSSSRIFERRGWIGWHKDQWHTTWGKWLTPTLFNDLDYPNLSLWQDVSGIEQKYLPEVINGLKFSGDFRKEGRGFTTDLLWGNNKDNFLGKDTLGGRNHRAAKAEGFRVLYDFNKYEKSTLSYLKYTGEGNEFLGWKTGNMASSDFSVDKFDLAFKKDRFEVLGSYEDFKMNSSSSTFDHKAEGYWVQPAYDLSDRLTTFVRFEKVKPYHPMGTMSMMMDPDRSQTAFGFAYNPIPTINLKLELVNIDYDTKWQGKYDSDRMIRTSVAVFF
ncbi:hypothetical protein MJH12_18675 [bacterium]|nr:hypothetical protein [bacterium]